MRVIYVDDERPALDNFRLTVAGFPQIDQLHLFSDGQAALDFAMENTVDVAFLDMEMPGIHGLALATKLRELHPTMRVVFVTAFSQFAMDAWNLDATGYVLKPYTAGDIQNQLAKCFYRPLPSQGIVIRTIPTLAIFVEGKAVHISGPKPRELFALLVDRGDCGITTGEGISCLWPDRTNDTRSQSLFRMTYKRLTDALDEAGIGHILVSMGNRRYLRLDQVDCDLYRILAGDVQAAQKYNGAYLEEYSWSESRNGQLHRMLLSQW